MLVNSQDSLDGRKMLKILFKMPGMPMGLSTLQTGDLHNI